MFVKGCGHKIKICGITVFRWALRNGRVVFYFCGIPIWFRRNDFTKLQTLVSKRVNEARHFDMRAFDAEIDEYVLKYWQKTKAEGKINNGKVAFLATELYDSGGHSELIKNSIVGLSSLYEIKLFLTQKKSTEFSAKERLAEIKSCAAVSEVSNDYFSVGQIYAVFEDIRAFAPKVLFSYIHPEDVFGAAVLDLLHRYTSTKIIYCPHASHYPNIGMHFSDISLEGMNTTAYITKHFRKFDKFKVVGISTKKIEDCPIFTEEQVKAKRAELGIPEQAMCTMSGASAYKFFDGEKSEYFGMVKSLLQKNENLYHVCISNFSAKHKIIIENIFADSEVEKRLILLPFSDEYELLFKCADVFIDSFPVSSALTQIDLMRLKVSSAVKINRENALWSFHEYMPADYPYMYDTVAEMEKGIEFLLKHKEAREKATEQNFTYFMEHYEGKNACQDVARMLENPESIKDFYQTLPSDLKYNFINIGA